jgi:hypothetical protein
VTARSAIAFKAARTGVRPHGSTPTPLPFHKGSKQALFFSPVVRGRAPGKLTSASWLDCSGPHGSRTERLIKPFLSCRETLQSGDASGQIHVLPFRVEPRLVQLLNSVEEILRESRHTLVSV